MGRQVGNSSERLSYKCERGVGGGVVTDNILGSEAETTTYKPSFAFLAASPSVCLHHRPLTSFSTGLMLRSHQAQKLPFKQPLSMKIEYNRSVFVIITGKKKIRSPWSMQHSHFEQSMVKLMAKIINNA